MEPRKPPVVSIEDKIIDMALGHVENMYILRVFLETGDWGQAFGMGGYCGDDLRWRGDSNGINYSVDGIDGKIKPAAIMNRAKQWVKDTARGQQLTLF